MSHFTYQLIIPDQSFAERPIKYPSLPASISYNAEAQAATLTVDGWQKTVTIPPGVKLEIRFNGGLPEILQLTPPLNPLRHVAWLYGFVQKMRYYHELDLLKAAARVRRRNPAGGDSVPVLTVHKERFKRATVVTYLPVGQSGAGQPWGWWADYDCPSEALHTLMQSIFQGGTGGGADTPS